jgi:hypothetical protein
MPRDMHDIEDYWPTNGRADSLARRVVSLYRHTNLIDKKDFSKLYKMAFGDREMQDLLVVILDNKYAEKRKTYLEQVEQKRKEYENNTKQDK